MTATGGRVVVTRDGPVLRVLLSHPGRRNALTWAMYDRLDALPDDVTPDVRCDVVGEGVEPVVHRPGEGVAAAGVGQEHPEDGSVAGDHHPSAGRRHQFTSAVGDGGACAPSAAVRIPRSRSTSAVCSPSRGAGLRTGGTTPSSRRADATTLTVPSSGCCTWWIIPRACTCGSHPRLPLRPG